MKYDAFISDSHSVDGRLAPALQNGLQRLARPWYRRRALRVFRDDTGLSVNPHLWGSIQDGLDESRYFVLLASPEAAASPWVNREIEHWLATRPSDTLLPILTDGTLVWDAQRGDFDPDQSSALPPALRGFYADEPRHLDLRWARQEDQLDLRHSRFRAQIAELAAPLHGVAREDLEGEDIRLHRHAIRLAWAASMALVVLTAAAFVAAGFAISYAATAREQRHHAVVLGARASRNATRAHTQEALAKKTRPKPRRTRRRLRRTRPRSNTSRHLPSKTRMQQPSAPRRGMTAPG